jgi:hypothetical protein
MKTLAEKMEVLVDKGKTAKLIKLATSSKKLDEQLAAIEAMRNVREEASVRAMMDMLKDEGGNLVVRKAVATTLDRIATKMETDKLHHYAGVEADPDIAKILREAAVNSKERTPRW